MDSKRLEKVARLIQKDLGEILQMEAVALFEGAMITVTKVRVSADLSVARVYVSIFALKGKSTQEIFKLLEEKNTLIKMKLAQRVRNQLRVIPQLSFFIDDSLDYLEKIDNLLKQ
ncbi:30S ribosome-binding factor [bioreactor metagenome]|jgi:ribosome-binding factor A|uniref:30S ribosome-binding factor n=1 Tax=bioreactor metagenome TaxID=1076179 RepID=A0A644VN53_9ZZZZ|nr:30S ribosome-binding factor RbfA [Bacteroidales bacterium]MEA4968156.1 30S ribosome-binding factor RbfA [Bacteroidaceae bacterium]NCC17728.1 30S ribosome-binding factor RbfA [Bacteroidia bacterium]MDD2577743.1 30S ribosome-binding factor RbfA [Bacteroidales bacterium]MDD3286014.1 30S ribosome-binding factor RbfA [Bacteroidales bacterium]